MTRDEKRSYARELRAEGFNARQIGAVLNTPESTIRNWTNGGNCEDCGAPLDGSKLPKSRWCQNCAPDHAPKFWTQERIILAIQAWAVEFGEPPARPDWDSYKPLAMNDPLRAARFRRYNARKIVPHFNTVVCAFGSWNAAIEAAGFSGRCNTGGCGNNMRRRNVRARLEREAA